MQPQFQNKPIEQPKLGHVCMTERARYGGGGWPMRMHIGKVLTNRRINKIYGLTKIVLTKKNKKVPSEQQVQAMVRKLLAL